MTKRQQLWFWLGLLYLTTAMIHTRLKDMSYEWITCGEALFRATGSAAPRDQTEEYMYNACLFQGVKRLKREDYE